MHGTWKTTHSGGPVVLAAGGVLLIIGAAEWIAARIWWVIGGTVLFLAVAGAVAFCAMRWLIRRQDEHAVRVWSQRAAQRAVQSPARPEVSPAARSAIAPAVVNLNFYGVPADERAAIIRTAIPGQAGDAITEGKC